MPRDKETIAVYDEQAGEFSERFSKSKSDPALARFMESLPAGGAILDFGCGPGRHAALMQAAGFQVVASDASASMVELARKHEGIEVRHCAFDELAEVVVYDGIWASFSLLHAARAEFPGHLLRIAAALKPRGYLHLGMKTGTGEHRDRLGRRYTYYTAEELRDLLQAAGFEVVQETTGESAGFAGDVSPWIEILARLPKAG